MSQRIIIDNRSSMGSDEATYAVARVIQRGHKMVDLDELCPVRLHNGAVVVPVYNKSSTRFIVEDT